MTDLTRVHDTGNGEALLDARDRAKNRRNYIIGGIAAAVVLAGSGLAIAAGSGKQDAEQQLGATTQQRDGAVAQVNTLSDQILAECAANRLTGPICPQAAAAKAEPVPGPLPTAAELTAAVAAYLADNPPQPGRPPTPAEVTAAVAGYLQDNPPQPGRPPTMAEVAAAVQMYYTANPPPPGAPGDPGPGPSAAQIAAAVDAYLRDNPPRQGDKGDPGTSPACLSEPRQCRGTDGTNGTDGKPPASWTFTDPAGTTYTCTRNNTNDAEPTYACSAPPPATESTNGG